MDIQNLTTADNSNSILVQPPIDAPALPDTLAERDPNHPNTNFELDRGIRFWLMPFAKLYEQRHKNINIAAYTEGMKVGDSAYLIISYSDVIFYSNKHIIIPEHLQQGYLHIPVPTNIFLSCMNQSVTVRCEYNFAQRSNDTVVRIGSRAGETGEPRVYAPSRPIIRESAGKTFLTVPSTHIQPDDDLEIEYYIEGGLSDQIKPIKVPANGQYEADITKWVKGGDTRAYFMYTFYQGPGPNRIRHFSEALYNDHW